MKTYAKGKVVPKYKTDWTPHEDAISTQNSRVLNAIFNNVDPSQFKMISTAEVAKEAWDILLVHFEGIDAVCESKLELLTAKFENLRMSEEENISDFNRKLCDVANELFALEEKTSEEKLVKNALRSLLPRFAYKTTTIRETKYLKITRLEDPMGSLLTFEIKLNEKSKKINKLMELRAEFELLVNEGNELT